MALKVVPLSENGSRRRKPDMESSKAERQEERDKPLASTVEHGDRGKEAPATVRYELKNLLENIEVYTVRWGISWKNEGLLKKIFYANS